MGYGVGTHIGHCHISQHTCGVQSVWRGWHSAPCAYEDAHDRYNGCNVSNEASALQCGQAELSLPLALSFSAIS